VEAVKSVDIDASSAPKTRGNKTMTDKDFEQLPTENIDWEQLGTENRELLRDWSQRKERELLDTATQCQHASSVTPVGRDRFFRCYWVFRSIPGLFVEESTDAISAHLNGPANNEIPTNNSPDDGDSELSQTQWSVYGFVDDVERLLGSLNARGFREGPLRVALLEQRDRLNDWVSRCDVVALSAPSTVRETQNTSTNTKNASTEAQNASTGAKNSSTETQNASTAENEGLVSTVLEMLLDLEERVYSGSLGSLKV